ncbi:MAG: hypothetical protein VR64_17890 [Desulfatitalea sp. BRH_c12]|nr:MAG: hypothetical protein VR64_17890 [Desulfatitalea sp. BRH_c12]
MEMNVNETLYPLVRDYMSALGTSRTTLVALKSYVDAVRRLACKQDDFRPQLLTLNDVIRNTKPKVVPLVHLIEAFEIEMQPHFNGPLESMKDRAIEILVQKLSRFEADTEKLTAHCMASISDDDLLIVHSPTAYIRNAIVRSQTEQRKNFSVLVLKQDFQRTKDLVSDLQRYNVAHVLIPEHNLSHFLADANKLFISAVTITNDGRAITGLGTANVVSICHAYKMPVYLFAETIKFSHRPLGDQAIFKEDHHKVEGDYSFKITVYSHDFVDLKMVDYLITENGQARMSSTA